MRVFKHSNWYGTVYLVPYLLPGTVPGTCYRTGIIILFFFIEEEEGGVFFPPARCFLFSFFPSFSFFFLSVDCILEVYMLIVGLRVFFLGYRV